MCSVITPPGMLRQWKRTSCPSLSSAMTVYWIHSPVAALKKGRKPVISYQPARARGLWLTFWVIEVAWPSAGMRTHAAR